MTKIDHAKIIADYQEAFKAANGFEINITYDKGYFKIDNGLNFVCKRAAEVIDMTAVLNQRVRNKELDKVS